MEMSNDYISELHVAQQRRRDKLRVQNFDDLHGHNFQHSPPPCGNITATTRCGNITISGCEPSPMMVPSEMLHFPTGCGGSSGTTPLSSVHATHFVVTSGVGACDLQLQQQTTYESWVDGSGRPRGVSVVSPQFLPQCSVVNQSDEFSYQNSGGHGWGNGENGVELPLLPHGLSLSLSSNQICEYQQHLGSGGGGGGGGDCRELKPFEGGTISSIVKQSVNTPTNLLECGNNNTSSSNNQVPDVAGSSIQVHRNVGPLGPFTGYAAILKSSKFLKPAQLLLDEFFAFAGIWRGGGEVEDGARTHGVAECSIAIVPKIHGSNDLTGRSPACESNRPDCHERKSKLLHMQEEVCKRHKQYHQQMQMVISAFDSVPGLSNATPYISRSIKTIMRHFRCLKNAIADQLQHIKRVLGEDSSASFLKGDSSSSLRYDQNFVKHKSSSVGGPCHLGNQSHVWKPQRGLPERAVSILRAWLFDHFLHPYPTDNDKQMLATQTGLTRNQVSNWFINARVRLWKPMVEEIHMLETRTPLSSEPNSNDAVVSVTVTAQNRQAAAGSNSGCKPTMNLGPGNTEKLEHLRPLTSLERPRSVTNTEQLFQKCSRIETHQVPANMSNSYVGFLPYQRQGLELGGIGAVSLTLGLRHGSETSHQQLQHQFIPQGLPFGGHVIHDFSA